MADERKLWSCPLCVNFTSAEERPAEFADYEQLKAALARAVDLLDDPAALRKAAELNVGGVRNRLLQQAEEIEQLRKLV